MNVVNALQERKIQAPWCWRVSSKKLYLSDSFATFFNCTPKELPTNSDDDTSFFSSSQLSDLQQALHNFIEDTKRQKFIHQTSHPIENGHQGLTLEWQAEVTQRNEQNEPVLIAGVAQLVSKSGSSVFSYRNQALLFQKLMKNLPDSIFFKDRESRFLAINAACAKKFGLNDPEEAIGKTDFDFFDEEHAQDAFNDEQQIIKTEKPILNKVEKEILEHEENNFREHWASTTKLPLYDKDGNVTGTFGITRDITQQVKAEKDLKENLALFNMLSERAPGFLYLHKHNPDKTVNFPYASEGINEILELSPEDLESDPYLLVKRVYKDDVKTVLRSIADSIQNIKEWDCEFRVVLPEKGIRWLRGRATPEKQPDGAVISAGYVTDITHQKEIIQNNVRLKEQLQQVIDSAPNLIFVKDIDGVFLMANKSAASFFDQTPESIVGKTDKELGVSDKNAKFYLDIEKKVIQQNEAHFIPEYKTTLPDGSEGWYQTIKVPFLNTDSGKPAVLSIVTNITFRKQKEMELSESLNIISQQNQRLMNFAHIVSHNLRNHAGNISMLLSLYNMEDSEVEQEELMKHMNVASERLNESIKDLNEIIDKQHQTKDDLKEINIRDQFVKVKEILTTEILNNQVKIEEDIPEDLTLTYNSAYLESILLNLLSNAIKYRDPDKRPIIKVRAFEQGERYHFEISDNGLGIDLDKHRDKLFGMYKTFHQNKNSKGIGLFITKNQIESMGGSIEVESKPNQGTTFKIVLK